MQKDRGHPYQAYGRINDVSNICILSRRLLLVSSAQGIDSAYRTISAYLERVLRILIAGAYILL